MAKSMRPRGGTLRERFFGMLLLRVPRVGSLRERFFGIEHVEIPMRMPTLDNLHDRLNIK
jgi:hypothetical protein